MSVTGFQRGRADTPLAVPAQADASQLDASELDGSQRAVIELAVDASAAVIGAPGTGKTTTLVELVADRVLNCGWDPAQVLALTTSRATATRLRDRLALRLAVPTTGPMARTVNSLAFEIVRDVVRSAGQPVPRLATGGEQDFDIAQLLEGHLEEQTGPSWPDFLGPQVRGLRRFRTELRELMMRATEYDVDPERLRALGRQHGHPEWIAAADFIQEYLAVVSNYRETQVDVAEIARFAVAAISAGSAGERVNALRLVVVDDLQEATESTVAILRSLAARGVAIVAFGDPDVAANAFRGGESDTLGRLATVLARPDLTTLTLSTSYRHGPELRALTAAVTARIGAAAAGTQRSAAARTQRSAAQAGPTPIALIQASSPAREWAAIARVLREEHLERGVPWSEMAVVVRSGAHIPVISRSLALAEVPTRSAIGGRALRDDHASRSLLTLIDVGIGRTALTPALASELLLGPFGGLDRLGLRRLRLALRAEEVAGGGLRSADDLLVDALSATGRLATIDHRVGRVAERLAETLQLLAGADGSIEEILWIAWERSGLAHSWREQALGTGITAADANRNLDGIVALFTAAKRFVERRPGEAASLFLQDVLEAEVPEDTLSPQPSDDAVLVTTPAGTVGLEFDTVVVAALQDGVWPDLRLRGSLLAPQELVRAVTGVDSAAVDERRQVLGDELRVFALAVSRARRRLVLATVDNDDEAPSMFLGLVPPGTAVIDSSAVTPLSLRGMVGVLRRHAVAGRARAPLAAASLAALASQSIPGASPDDWHGLIDISSTGPLYQGQPIPVSPSSIEKLVDSPMDWFLEKMAGSESGVIAGVGTIMHWAMETAENSSVEALWAVIESRWNELLFDAPWLAERQRRIALKFTEALSEYLRDFERAGKELVGAESGFRLELGDAVVSGSIDRVERSGDGAVVIVDLKTGTPVTSQSKIDENPQLAAYQLAYADGQMDVALAELGEHRGGGAKLLFVKEGTGGRKYREAVQAQLDDEQLEAFRERVREASMLIAAAEFAGRLELPGFGIGDPSRLRAHRVRAVSSD